VFGSLYKAPSFFSIILFILAYFSAYFFLRGNFDKFSARDFFCSYVVGKENFEGRQPYQSRVQYMRSGCLSPLFSPFLSFSRKKNLLRGPRDLRY